MSTQLLDGAAQFKKDPVGQGSILVPNRKIIKTLYQCRHGARITIGRDVVVVDALVGLVAPG